MTEDDEVMLTPEASAFLKRPIATLYGWRLRRQGPPSFRQGRLVCYWKSDLVQWLKDQEAAEYRYAKSDEPKPAEPHYAKSDEPKPVRRPARPVTKQAARQRKGTKGAA